MNVALGCIPESYPEVSEESEETGLVGYKSVGNWNKFLVMYSI